MRIEFEGAPVFVGQGGLVAPAAGSHSPSASSDRVASVWRGGDAPRLMLLHGAGMDRTVWVLLVRYFARHGIDVVVPDLPGHGASGGEPLRDIASMAGWCERLLDDLQRHHGLGDGPLVLGGHSMGSLVSLALGERLAALGDAVDALVLFGSGYPMAVGDELLDAAERDPAVAADMIAIWGHAYASRLGHNTVPGISVSNVARALLRRAAPGVLHADLAACHAWSGAERAAEALEEVDVHLVMGDEDRMTPPAASRALAALTGARCHRIARSGHMMMAEQPERVLEVLREILEPLLDATAGG